MILYDSKGNPIKKISASRNDSCPGCGAKREKRKPVLGGKMVCMQCGHISEEEQNEN